jgi:hypothetical protein
MTIMTELSPDLLARANDVVKRFHECFWFRHPEAKIQNVEDVRLVIEHLREYGGHRAWWAAQNLHQCLSHHSNKTS